MLRSVRLLAFLLLTTSLTSAGFGQLRVVTYNTATSGQSAPSTPRSGMDVVLEAIGDESRLGIAKPIDVLLLQEIQSSGVTGQAFVNILNGIYGPGTYTRAALDPFSAGAGRPGLVYNTQTVQLVAATSLSNAGPRDTARYRLRPVGYGADADFYVYNDHYRAGSDPSDQSSRASHAATIRSNANALGEGAHIIYAGDYNIQSSSETMYQTLLGAGAGQAFDPISRPGTWNNNTAFEDVHTQSPYDPDFNDPSLIGGGMDDRFDFQLVSGEMMDGEGVAYLPGSYHAFGNNGSHSLNDPINDPSNTAQPANVLNALAAVSDHLPVVADYQLPAVMQIAGPASAGRAILGSSAGVQVDVWNAATVVAANGADELDYTASGSGGLSGMFDDVDQAMGGANTHTFLLDTSTLGAQSGAVNVTSSSPQVVHPMLNLNVDYEIVQHSNASLDANSDVDSTFFDLGVVAPGSVTTTTLELHNLGTPGLTAALDLLTIDASLDVDTFDTELTPFVGLEAGQVAPFMISLDTSASGNFAVLYSLLLADEDIPGQLANQNISVGITASVALPGDANLDGTVDGADFVIWNSHKFMAGTDFSSGDFNGDGITDGGDFILWNNYKFTSLDLASVPEPGAALIPLWLLLAWFRSRN